MKPIYWRDPASGQGYIVQVQVPIRRMNSIKEVELTMVKGHHNPYHGTGTGDGMNGGVAVPQGFVGGADRQQPPVGGCVFAPRQT